jgi:hypothetical protein
VTDGLTYWWMKDSAWWRREYLVELGDEFGPAGPAVVDWLACEAKAQNDGGRVKAGFRATARGTFITDPGEAAVIVGRAAELGALDDLEVMPDGRRFTCRVSGWRNDQERAQAAERNRRYRDRHAPSRTVTRDAKSENGTRKGKDSTGEVLPTGGGQGEDPAATEARRMAAARRVLPEHML